MQVPKPKKKKVIKIGVLKRAIQVEFNHWMASGKPCAVCGNVYPVMQCSHLHSIGAYPNLRFDPMNVLPMCGKHHFFFWHDDPIDAWSWLNQKFPGRYAYLEKAKNKDIFWSVDMLLEIRQKIRNQDIKGLIIAPELLTAS